MRTYSEDTIVNDVRTAIDENTSVTAFTDSDGNSIDPDTLEMEDIIKSKIADGINAVRTAAPLHTLEPEAVSPAVTWTDKEAATGYVRLPSSFLRLALFKMSDWRYGVSQALSPTSAEYRQQFSEYGGVRGNPYNPVVALSVDGSTGKDVLQFFSSASATATAELLYVKKVTERSSAYKIEETLYKAVVLKTAALVMANYVNADMMQLLNSLCNEELSINN